MRKLETGDVPNSLNTWWVKIKDNKIFLEKTRFSIEISPDNFWKIMNERRITNGVIDGKSILCEDDFGDKFLFSKDHPEFRKILSQEKLSMRHILDGCHYVDNLNKDIFIIKRNLYRYHMGYYKSSITLKPVITISKVYEAPILFLDNKILHLKYNTRDKYFVYKNESIATDLNKSAELLNQYLKDKNLKYIASKEQFEKLAEQLIGRYGRIITFVSDLNHEQIKLFNEYSK